MAKDSLHTKTILLVDDEPELLHLLETVLRADGFERIVTASDVTSGLAAYEQHHPDLAILDVMFRQENLCRSFSSPLKMKQLTVSRVSDQAQMIT